MSRARPTEPCVGAPPAFEHDVALDRLNTFGLPARAARLVRIDSVAGLQALVRTPAWRDEPRRLVLGGGSNVVLTGDFPGLVLKVELRGRRLLGEDGDAWLVEAGGGENWHDFVCWTLAEGCPGLENLALIPGTVGAAPVQNIGAYGLEMAERFAGLDAVDLHSGELRAFDAAACAFGYRDSVFRRQPGRWLIVAVRFRLPRRWRANAGYAELARELAAAGVVDPAPEQVARAVIAVRRRKLPDPAETGNAGSFFKNPVVDAEQAAALAERWPDLPRYPQADGRCKLAAGWLIERCGCKARDFGPVGCHANQALVLVNRGGATGADVRRAAEAVRSEVRRCFGIDLEPEPVFV
ncbi:UDP-N-acetylmuramate dehydrogenase [Pseudothauera nasutitermitis]|uniref:UDP-N-acetylenolpyruvoylglucosamine reductase n=1 Tax=Pseudothauera nasutitermitis TaxID=2565930 RepID=A0A4S4AW52_9RHOO|nr:UDP-N-acetylmuramate dehydrogenase [Pseudothauera nasutitermitis]THF62818.1 UDP-N-acetylmuramate dehydrogenase [Pseudothauera nasutitermitis]